MSTRTLEIANTLREFLFDKVYNSNLANEDKENAKNVLHLLYTYFLKNEERLPEEFRTLSNDVDRKVTDYIAGMTDQYAIRVAKEITL
jgi:dGTPase